MANRANLIATYNANPTLKSRYTLQEYLDLFGFGEIPPTLPVQPADPNDAGIPNIINQALNQNLGGGDGIDNKPQTNPRPTQTYTRTYAPDLNFAEFTSGIEGTPSYTQEYTKPTTIFDLYQKFAPAGIVMKYFNDKKIQKQAQTKQALDQVAMQQKIREAEAAAAAAEAAALANAQRTGRRPTAPRGGGIQDSQSLGNPSAGQTGGYSYDSGGRQGFGYGLADGGRVYLYNRLK